jgi:hypothetical protein
MCFFNTLKLLVCSYCLICLVACGGGGSSSSASIETKSSPSTSPSSTLAVQTGSFVDSVVGGIGYKTATQSGITDQFGNYQFIPGEKVTFFIGAVTFPAATASTTVTPLAMASSGSLSDPVVTNVAYLLQSLDFDNAPETGIQIDQRDAALATNAINFNQDPAAFVTDPNVVKLIAAVDALKTSPSQMTTTIASNNLGKTLIGLIDSQAIPSPGCDKVNTQTVLNRVSYSTNFWASVIVKPNNANGFVYGGAFRNIGSNPGGAFAWYQPKADSNEIAIAKKSGQWSDDYSPKYDVWLQHSQNTNIVMRVAVTPQLQETTTTPKYAGTSIYLMYKGPVGTYLSFQFQPGTTAVAYFSYFGTSTSTFYTGTAGIDGVMGDGDDGVLPLGIDQIWLQHLPGQPNYPPNMHSGATTPYGRILNASECVLMPGGSVQIWATPTPSTDLLFSPSSQPNFWGHDAPLYTDATGYQGSIGIRSGIQAVSVVQAP